MIDLEERIRELGRPLAERTLHLSSNESPLESQRNKLFERCIQDPTFKSGLLGFLELYPSLTTPTLFAEHLDEYLGSIDLGPLFGAGAAIAKRAPLLLNPIIKTLVEQTAKSFIIEETIEKAATMTQNLTTKGTYLTIDILGELTASSNAAARYEQSCLHALDILNHTFGTNTTTPEGKPVINLSTKVSALSAHFDPLDYNGTKKDVLTRLLPIALRAKEIGAFLNIDMEHYQYRDLITSIFTDLINHPELKNYPHLGTVVQAYLKDSPSTINNLLTAANKRNTPFTIRLVKGAYWDQEIVIARQNGWEIPVFEHKFETDQNYEFLTQTLLHHHSTLHTALGTHNLRSIAHGLAVKEHFRVQDSTFETQLLYGMGGPIAKALIERKHQVRLYGPVGSFVEGMGYFVRRILENTANGSFLRKLDPNTPLDDLLSPPTSSTTETSIQTTPYKPTKRWFHYLLPFLTPTLSPPMITSTELPPPLWNHPQAAWHTASARDSMDHALDRLQQKINRGGLNYYSTANHEEQPRDDAIYSFNPSIDSIIDYEHISTPLGKVTRATPQHIECAIKAAANAFPSWKNASPQNRSDIIKKMGQIMAERTYDLAALICLEAGKPRREAHADVIEAIDFCTYYANQSQELFNQRHTQRVPGEKNTGTYVPQGPMSIIAPWNFPLAILVGMTTAALATGNTVVMKPSPETPLIAAEFASIAKNAGIPDGVLNYIVAKNEDAKQLVESPLIYKVIFTGSVGVGSWIYETVAKQREHQTHLKTAICEMGGKNAVIVDDTADLDQAVKGIVYSAFGFSGQKCSATSKVIVLDSILDEFTSRLLEAVSSLQVGPAHLPGTDVGPVINRTAYEKITRCVTNSINEGTIPLLLGKQEHTHGYYIHPTILKTDPQNSIATTEVFGPVLALMQASNFNAAITILNGTSFGLTAGLYSRTPSHHREFQHSANAGNLYINRGTTGAIVERHPFGGFNMSGTGPKAGGENYLKAFVYEKHCATNTVLNGYVGE